MARLCLCVNQVAKIRKISKNREPDPVDIAISAEIAGIDGIVVQLRDDRSDITDRDVEVLKEVVKSHLNLVIPINEELTKKAIKILPDMVTLLPTLSESSIVNPALDVETNYEYIEDIAAALRANNIVVSVLIEPDVQQIRAAARAEVDYVQFTTAPLARVEDLGSMNEYIEKLRSAAMVANKLGLGVSVGQGLTFQNIREFGDMSFVEEMNVGKSIIARSLLVGVEQAVRHMKSFLV